MSILIVFFSNTGNTKVLAEAILKEIKCDIEEITEIKVRKGFLGFMRSGFEAIAKKCPDINPLEKDTGSYDIVIIGTPIWAMNL